MKFDYIGEITVVDNNVFVMKRIGDNMFQSIRDDVLSDAYNKDGQQGLDRAVIEQMWKNTVLEGNDPSVKRYKGVFWKPEAIQAEHEYHMTVFKAMNARPDPDEKAIAEVEAIKKTALNKFFDTVVEYLPKI